MSTNNAHTITLYDGGRHISQSNGIYLDCESVYSQPSKLSSKDFKSTRAIAAAVLFSGSLMANSATIPANHNIINQTKSTFVASNVSTINNDGKLRNNANEKRSLNHKSIHKNKLTKNIHTDLINQSKGGEAIAMNNLIFEKFNIFFYRIGINLFGFLTVCLLLLWSFSIVPLEVGLIGGIMSALSTLGIFIMQFIFRRVYY